MVNSVFIDTNLKKIVFLSNTKASTTLYDLKKDDKTFVFVFQITGYFSLERKNFKINYDFFGIPEENRIALSAKEYLDLLK